MVWVDFCPHRYFAGLSKWAAEQLVTEAGRRGLPTLSIRFGNIGWDTESAKGNALDFQGLILNGCATLGKAIDLPGFNFECTPVDFASKSLVQLASHAPTLKQGHVLNCTQDGFTPFRDIYNFFSASTGSKLDSVDFNLWSNSLEDEALNSKDETIGALFSFISGLDNCMAYLQNVPELDCSTFDKVLGEAGSTMKRKGLVSSSYFENYFKSILPQNQRKSDAAQIDPSGTEAAAGPLAGKGTRLLTVTAYIFTN